MKNRPLYVRKFHSGRLKEFGWQIAATFEESKEANEIAPVSDNQILRTIRDVSRRTLNREKLERLILLKNFYKASPTGQEEARRLQGKIDRTLFQEDYIVVVMDNVKQYEYLYKNGFQVNEKTYRRLSCSAGQARVSTVIFCNEAILLEVKRRLNNGRNMDKKLSPSKFNAYFGLAGSATSIVSEPSFLVVEDYENTISFLANYVIENGPRSDDTIVKKQLTGVPMNRTDGMGLISYRQASLWAKELGLSYVPSQFCIRQNFIKGMLCTFPIHEFAREYGQLDENGRCMVDTIYRDSQGKPVKKNLFDCDVILSGSQFKLWDSFDSLEQYIENCHKNKLYWGVSLTSPREPKHMLKLNYQFIQTLNLSKSDVEKLAEPFIRWIRGVSYEDPYYMLLFLLGVNNDEAKIKSFLEDGGQPWIKALILDHGVKNDPYVRTKIRELIRGRISRACKGDIYTEGNFQVIVSDPFGFMQHVCGLPVTGLLKPGMSYSNYWNERGVSQVDAMRSPLTDLSEHVVLTLQKDEETERWFRFCKQGIILNYYGNETFHFAGSDFDFDILATTPDPVMIRGVYRGQLPVVYKAPKPQKIRLTEDDLFRADTFSFGSIIGSITNKSSNGYALLPLIRERYGEDSQQFKLVRSRLQQCCKAQSAQIDKAKIGRDVKGIPDVWVTRQKIKTDKKGRIRDRHRKQKELYNSVLLDRHPYFFRYVYKETDRAWKKYLDEANTIARQKFCMDLSSLEQLPERTDEQEQFLADFYRYSPVTLGDSPMNLLCRYIEKQDFHISRKIREENDFDPSIYQDSHTPYLDIFPQVSRETERFLKERRASLAALQSCDRREEENEASNPSASDRFQILCQLFSRRMEAISPNPYAISNCLVDHFYREKPKSSKDILWGAYGQYLCMNIKNNKNISSVRFPMPCRRNGDLEYMGYEYRLQEVRFEL